MTKNRKKAQRKGVGKIIGWIVIAIVVVALVFVGVVAYINRGNIEALYRASKSSSEEISVRQEQNRQKTQEILDTITNAEITELSDEAREKLKNGEITEEQSIDIILGRETIESVMEKGGANADKKEQTGPVVPAEDDKPDVTDGIQEQGSTGKKEEIIAKIYLLRAEFLNKIDGLIESGKAIRRSIPQSERTMSKKMAVINQLASQGNALEASCDARMEQLLGELEAELVRLGESTAPIAEIRGAYQEQKQIKKEEIFSMYYPD